MKYYGNGVHSYKVINDDLMIGVTHCFKGVNTEIGVYGGSNIVGVNCLFEGFNEITKEQFDKDFNKVMNQLHELNNQET